VQHRHGRLNMLSRRQPSAFLSRRIRISPDRLPGRRTVLAASLAMYLAFGLWSAGAVGRMEQAAGAAAALGVTATAPGLSPGRAKEGLR